MLLILLLNFTSCGPEMCENKRRRWRFGATLKWLKPRVQYLVKIRYSCTWLKGFCKAFKPCKAAMYFFHLIPNYKPLLWIVIQITSVTKGSHFSSVGKDERETKENIGKLMKKTAYVPWYIKMHWSLRLKQC